MESLGMRLFSTSALPIDASNTGQFVIQQRPSWNPRSYPSPESVSRDQWLAVVVSGEQVLIQAESVVSRSRTVCDRPIEGVPAGSADASALLAQILLDRTVLSERRLAAVQSAKYCAEQFAAVRRHRHRALHLRIVPQHGKQHAKPQRALVSSTAAVANAPAASGVPRVPKQRDRRAASALGARPSATRTAGGISQALGLGMAPSPADFARALAAQRKKTVES
jgi:hypothetical protein